MATLTADRHLAQRSLLDPHEEDRLTRRPQPRTTPARPAALPQQRDQPAVRPAGLDQQPARPAALDRPRETDRFQAPAGPTLDDLVAGTWDALTVTHAAACFVCGDDLAPRWGAGPNPVAAVCNGCGSDLS